MVERMLSMYEVLGSIPSYLKFNDFYANLSKIISPLSCRVPTTVFTFCKPTETDKTMINWGCSSVVECMLCMYEVMGSIPSISKHCLMTFKQI